MSYILEALRKSERERQAGQAAPPALVPVDQAPPRRRGSVWPIALVIALNAAVLGYLWFTRWGKSDPPPEVAAESVAASDVAAAQSGFVPAPSSSAEIQAPPEEKRPAPVQAEQPPITRRVDEKAGQPATPPRAAKPAPSEKIERLSAKASGKIRQRLDQEPGIEPAAEKDIAPPVEFRALADVPEPRDPAEPTNPSAIPFLQAMPVDFQQRAGPVTINVFAYSEQPEERFAIIDMKKYRVGDRTQGGAELLEIRSDSLVLRWEGRKFRVPRP
ncbi:general secretion pathway protein GspB [Methylocaldum sp. MU1018]|jgi:general secretion pathway protein B